MRRALGSIILAAVAVLTFAAWDGLPVSALAAIQGPVDEKFKIPVPKQQRKIAVGEEKLFEEGDLTVTLLALERTAATVSVNGGEAFDVPASSLTLVEKDPETICTLVYLGKVGARAILSARCDPASDELHAALAEQLAHVGDEIVSPVSLVAETEKGDLKNPYSYEDADTVEEGRNLFLANSCNGCHGGTGGGGMGPPLSNAVWVYGSEDDTLFRLVTLGSDALQEEGYVRKGRESVVGPMPAFGEIIEDSQQLWKILTFVRTVYNDDPTRKTW